MAMSFIDSGSVSNVLAKAKVSTETKAIGFFNARVLNSEGNPMSQPLRVRNTHAGTLRADYVS